MGKFTNTIDKLKSSQSTISRAINEKLGTQDGGGLTYKFSEMADKIREIEAMPEGQYKVIVCFGNVDHADNVTISFTIKENNSEGKELLNIFQNVDKKEGIIDQYKYYFNTESDQIYIENNCSGSYDGYAMPSPPLTKTLTDLKKHKTIRLTATTTPQKIEYAD